jgi:hypothetical protein
MANHRTLWLASALMISASGFAQTTPEAPTLCIDDAPCQVSGSQVKWHPGHYLDTDSIERPGDDPKNISLSVLTSIANTPFKGALVRYGWTTLEPTKDAYDFSRIRAHRDALAGIGKRLIVQVQDRTFSGDGPPPAYITPAYILRDPLYEGGWAPRGSGTGAAPKLWLAPVMDRQIALQAALARAFDSDPWIEMVSFEETSLFNAPPPGYSKTAMATQYRRLADAMNASWSSTNACILTNFFHAPSDLRDLIDYFISRDICVGGPDVRPDNIIDGSEILSGQFDGRDRRDQAAIIFHNEWRSLDGTWSLEQLQDYQFDTNKAHYTTWSKKESTPGLTYSGHIRPWVINTRPATRATCPTSYDGCKTD